MGENFLGFIINPIIDWISGIIKSIIGFFVGLQLMILSAIVKFALVAITAALGLLLAFPVGAFIYGFAILVRVIDGFVYAFTFPGLSDFITGVDSNTSLFFRVIGYVLIAALIVSFLIVVVKWGIYSFKSINHELVTDLFRLGFVSLGRILGFVGFGILFILAFKYLVPVIYVMFVSFSQTIIETVKSSTTGAKTGFMELFITKFQKSMEGVYSSSPIKSGHMLISLISLLDVGGDQPVLNNIDKYYKFLNIPTDGTVPSGLPNPIDALNLSLETLWNHLGLGSIMGEIFKTIWSDMTSLFSGLEVVLNTIGGGFVTIITKLVFGLFRFFVFYLFIKSMIKWLYTWGVKLIVSLSVMLLGLVVYTPLLSLYIQNNEQYQSVKSQWTQHIKTTAFNIFTGMFIFFIPIGVTLFQLLLLTLDGVNFLGHSSLVSLVGLFLFIFAGDLYNWIINKIADVLKVEIWAEMEVGSRLINKSLAQIKKTASQALSIGASVATGGGALIGSAAKSAASLAGGVGKAATAFKHRKTGGDNPFLAYKKHVSRQVRGSNLKEHTKNYAKTQWTNTKSGSKKWTYETGQNLGKAVKENVNPYISKNPKQLSNLRSITSEKTPQNLNGSIPKLDELIKKMTNKKELQLANQPKESNKNVEKLLKQIAQNSEVNKNQTLAKIDGMKSTPKQTIINNLQVKDSGSSVGKIKMINDLKEVKKLTNKIEHLTNKIDKN